MVKGAKNTRKIVKFSLNINWIRLIRFCLLVMYGIWATSNKKLIHPSYYLLNKIVLCY